MNTPAWALWKEQRWGAAEILASLGLVPPRDALGLYPRTYTDPAVDVHKILDVAGVQVLLESIQQEYVQVTDHPEAQIRIQTSMPPHSARFALAYGLGCLVGSGAPKEARQFAAALLMPAPVVEFFAGQHPWPLELAPLFQVSPRVMRARMESLRLL